MSTPSLTVVDALRGLPALALGFVVVLVFFVLAGLGPGFFAVVSFFSLGAASFFVPASFLVPVVF